jgi:hypothetical protein
MNSKPKSNEHESRSDTASADRREISGGLEDNDASAVITCVRDSQLRDGSPSLLSLNRVTCNLGLVINSALWWLFLFLATTTALYLWYVCLFDQRSEIANPHYGYEANANQRAGPVAAPAPSALPQAPPAASSVPDPNQLKVTELAARLNEMSERIREVGEHSSRILTVIGLLIGFLTFLVAIGLWHSKQYVDRIVERAELSLGKSLEGETRKQLQRVEQAISGHADKISELETQRIAAVSLLQDQQAKTLSDMESFSGTYLSTSLRLGIPLMERFRQLLDNAADLTAGAGMITSQDHDGIKKQLGDLVWIQTQILRALTALESSSGDEVIGAAQTLYALGDRSCLPSLEAARARWKSDPRVLEQISDTYRHILSTK